MQSFERLPGSVDDVLNDIATYNGRVEGYDVPTKRVDFPLGMTSTDGHVLLRDLSARSPEDYPNAHFSLAAARPNVFRPRTGLHYSRSIISHLERQVFGHQINPRQVRIDDMDMIKEFLVYGRDEGIIKVIIPIEVNLGLVHSSRELKPKNHRISEVGKYMWLPRHDALRMVSEQRASSPEYPPFKETSEILGTLLRREVDATYSR